MIHLDAYGMHYVHVRTTVNKHESETLFKLPLQQKNESEKLPAS